MFENRRWCILKERKEQVVKSIMESAVKITMRCRTKMNGKAGHGSREQ